MTFRSLKMLNRKLLLEYKLVLFMIPILLLVTITGIFTYGRLSNIIEDLKDEIQPKNRAITAKEVLGEIIDAENSVKSYSITRDTVYLDAFYQKTNEVEQKVEFLLDLKPLTEEHGLRIVRLDSVVREKMILLHELLLLKDQFRVDQAFDKLELEVEQVVTGASTPETSNPKKRKLSEIFRIKERKTEVNSKDKLTIAEVKKELNDVRAAEKSIAEQLKSAELELILRNKEITKEIRQIITSIEESEFEAIEAEAKKIASQLKESNSKVAWFFIITGFLLIIMVAIIMNYVTNGIRYRKALRRAKVETENLARTKEKFLANMSHEIRTPMNAIAGFTEQIAKGPLNDEQREQLNMVRSSTDHLLYLINDILDLNKLQIGKMQLEKINFEPSKVVNNVIEFVKPLVGEKDLEIDLKIDKNVPEVLVGDPFRLRQILLNLVSNSIKFTPSGKISIEARAKMVNSDSIHLNLEVTDTGIGMNQMEVEKLFHEFEQAEVSTASNYGGTGLGLSITKMLIELYEGTIDIRSDKNKGTKVVIQIPFKKGHGNNVGKAQNQKVNTDFLKGLRVLIVDDEDYNRKLLTTILSKYKVVYTEAKNGLKALNELKQNNYDLILMDIRMPEVDGIEATRRIRKLKQKEKSKIPIIALTAAIMHEDQEEYKKVEMNDFLAKPFSEKELLNVLQNVLSKEPETEKIDVMKEDDNQNAAMMNFDELKSMSEGDHAFYIDMLETFIKSMSTGMKDLRIFSTEKDWQNVAEVAHKILTPCNHLGAKELYKELKEVEQLARHQENPKRINTLVKSVQDKMNAAIKEVEIELSNTVQKTD